MSVEFFPCNICDETICDVGPYFICANCEDLICEECCVKQEEKYGLVDPNGESAECYGENALKFCDTCAPNTLEARIAIKEAELAELKKQLKNRK